MAKHNTGPWPILRAKDGRTILQIGKCAPSEYAGAAWLDVTEEDARLIAASHVLLDALIQCRAALVTARMELSEHGQSVIDRKIEIATAAIAAAEGEA